MPSNYFACPACGTLELITYRLADTAQEDWPPACYAAACDGTMELAPQPGDFTMDAGGVKGAAFRKFDVDVDGRAVTIDSLHTLRRIERESEQRYRNGEGEPLRFRMWNQDRSNRDVNAFGTAGRIGDQTYDSGTPAPRSAKVDIRRHGPRKPRISIAKHGGQSPLGGL